MNPPPPGWPRIASTVVYQDPKRAIDWLCAAFGFEVRIRHEAEDGTLVHSELTYGGGLIMVTGEGGWNAKPDDRFRKSPRTAGGNTQSLMVYVHDVGAHSARAVEHGAKVMMELTTSDYGEAYWADRGYGCEDPEGHVWYFAQRLRTGGT